MSKVLIISAVFPPEPVVAAALASDLADELAQKYEVVVLCPKPTRPDGFHFERDGASLKYKLVKLDSYTCPASSLLGRLRESYSLGRHSVAYIKKKSGEFSCIYVQVWPLFAQYLIVKAAKKLKIPCIVHVHDIYPESLVNKFPNPFNRLIFFFLLPIDQYILQNATRIIGISRNLISYLSVSRKVEMNKFQMVRNWQDDTLFINYLRSDTEKFEFIYMYLGSISPSAGVGIIINSFHQANLLNAKLIIAGNGSDKESCLALVQRLGNSKIEFCDITPDKVPEMQSQSDVLLLPLLKGLSKTATPSKLTAYLLSAKPIIACVEKDSDVAEIIYESSCGYVVEPENIDSMVLALKKVYQIPKKELEVVGLNGKKYALLNLTRKVNLQKLVAVIESVF